MNDYIRGVWEALNYTTRFLKDNEKTIAIEEFETILETIEDKLANNFGAIQTDG